ncbi:hypothetical protein DL768_000203 [Monosporascus sp. mg162]|nr:hypothetical protein DL768_000203 [Monosporascus sp. mg162]
MRLASEGKTNEAASKLRTAIAGFQNLLSPTHDLTEAAAFELARILGHSEDMEEANAIMTWLASNSTEKYGLHSEKTITLYVKIVELLRSWPREEDAQLLMYKIAEAWEDTDNLTFAAAISGISKGDVASPSLPEANIRVQFEEAIADEDDFKIQLRLIEVLMPSNKAPPVDMEGLLQNLVTWCEKNDLLMPTIRSRSCLAKHYKSKGLRRRGEEVLDVVLPSIEEHFRVADPLTQGFLRIRRELAFLCLDLGSHSKCDDILGIAADSLECKKPSSQDDRMIVNFLIAVGNEWQKRSHWELAAPWLERALVHSMKRLGKSHCKTKILEKALEEGRFVLGGQEILNSSHSICLAINHAAMQYTHLL